MPFWNEAWGGEVWHRISHFATLEGHSQEAIPNLTWVVRRSVLVLGSRLMFSLWNVYAHMYPVSLVRLIKLLNKRLWLMQKALSCSSGVVPVFCGLGSPGKWTDGVRECELVTTATLKDCCQRDAVFSWYLFSLPQSAVWNLSFDLNRRDTENPKQVDRRLTLCFSGLFQTVIAVWVLKWYVKNGMFLLFLNFWRMLGLWASVLHQATERVELPLTKMGSTARNQALC